MNNGMLATIRMHQERTYPDRPSASDLVNPDFAAYARAFGGFGAVIERTEQFPEAFEQALASGVPAVLELRVDPEAILPGATLSEIRQAARDSPRRGAGARSISGAEDRDGRGTRERPRVPSRSL